MTYKLLFVTTVPVTIRSFLLPFIAYFRSLGWQVDGMAREISADRECVAACDRVYDVEWSRNIFDPRNLSATSWVKQVVKEGNYDLVHVHTPIAAFVTRYALKDLPTQVIYTAHGFHFYRGGSLFKNAIFLNLEKLAGAWTDYLIVINDEDCTAAREHNFLPSERIFYTRGIGVDINYYASHHTEAKSQVRQELNLATDDLLLLSIAEFAPRKRHRDLLNAFAKLSDLQQTDETQCVHLALAGEGPIKTEIEQLAVELGVSEKVHFLGFRRDIPTLIQAANAVILISQQEGLPRSIMEAMCLNTPVIGSDIRGTRDLLSDNCGLLVELGNTEAIARAMMRVREDSESLAKMAEKARIKIKDYDIEQIIEQYAAIYSLAINNK